MIDLEIPGRGRAKYKHLVCDVNGTLALDGQLFTGVVGQIKIVSGLLTVHLVTADTHGKQAAIDQELGMKATILKPGDEAAQKAEFVEKLGSPHVIAIGQGANDRLMLEKAGLGICVLSDEGTCMETMLAADMLVADILKAFELITHPTRMIATLRQ